LNYGEGSQPREASAVILATCQHLTRKKYGRNRNGSQRYKCQICQATFTEEAVKPLGELRLSMEQATQALNLLLEGMSVRATARVTGLRPNTICDLIVVVGENCQRFLPQAVNGVATTEVQCDELWSFVTMKERQRIRGKFTGEEGDSWTWLAIDRHTKLILTHHVAQRDGQSCDVFLRKLYNATTGRFQLSTDGFKTYTLSVPYLFHGEVDFAQLIKIFQPVKSAGRYSPGKIAQAKKNRVYGNPDPAKVSTSHVERTNLSVRMHVRRFTRLTNAHSKSLRHHKAMQAIFVAWFNFCRRHETIKQTPAMAAELTGCQWTMRELIEQAAAA
jgi:transposase-like protein/IS1 family transposase